MREPTLATRTARFDRKCHYTWHRNGLQFVFNSKEQCWLKMPVLNEMPPTTFSVADIGPLTAAHTPAFTEVDHVTKTDFCGKKKTKQLLMTILGS